MTAVPIRFVATAALARAVNEGFPLAVVLLARERTGSAATAGWMVAAATFPQLLTGPLLAPLLDRSRHPWRLMRIAGMLTLAASVLIAITLGRHPIAIAVAGAVLLACVEPLHNGGISALAGRADDAERLFAWDSLAYNIAGLAGPGVVTLVVWLVSPAWALTALGALCASIVVTSLGLDVADSAHATREVQERTPLRRALDVIVSRRRLRSVTLASTIAFAAFGALPLALVAATDRLDRPASAAGLALTLSAVGGLVGSLVMTRLRLPTRPEVMVLAALAGTGGALLLMSAPSWPLLLAGAVALGVIDAPLLVGLFAVRRDESPTDARASVFTIAASLKLGVASLGAALAGALLGSRATSAGLMVIAAVQFVAMGCGWLALHAVRSARPLELEEHRA